MPGGRAGRLEMGGYRFDTGPTVLTMPSLLEHTFAGGGRRHGRPLALSAVDPMYRATFADGSVIHVRHGREAMAEEIRATCGPAEAAAFGRFADWLGELYHLEMADVHRPELRLAARPGPPARPGLRLLRPGGLRAWRPRSAASSATSASAGCSASSRCTPASLRMKRSPCTA